MVSEVISKRELVGGSNLQIIAEDEFLIKSKNYEAFYCEVYPV
jgi:hypothetical protein